MFSFRTMDCSRSRNEYEIPTNSISHLRRSDLEENDGNKFMVALFHGEDEVLLRKLRIPLPADFYVLVELDHPHVLKILGFIRIKRRFHLVMPMCKQGPLADVLRKRSVNKSMYVNWSKQIADGMLYLHSNGIFHGDFCSKSILLDCEDRIQITGFDLTFSYKPRLQPTSAGFDIASIKPYADDVYNLGIVLLEMLIEKSGLSTRFNIRLGMDKKNLSPLMPKDAPMSLQTLIRWCWSDQPQNRPKDLAIITQLDNLACELAELTDEEWSNKKKHWKNPCSQSGSPASTIISESDHGVMSHDSKASATFPNFQLPQFSNEEMTMTVLEALTQLTKEVKSIRQNQENLANEVEHLRRQFEGARQIFHRRQPSVASKTTTSGFQSRQSLLASPEKEASRHRNSLCTCRNCGHLFYGGSNQCLKDGPNASKSLTAVHELVHELEDRSTSVPFELTSIVQSITASNESDEVMNDLIGKSFH